jgi:hypothetical protein
MGKAWSPKDVPDLTGRVVIVTGARYDSTSAVIYDSLTDCAAVPRSACILPNTLPARVPRCTSLQDHHLRVRKRVKRSSRGLRRSKRRTWSSFRWIWAQCRVSQTSSTKSRPGSRSWISSVGSALLSSLAVMSQGLTHVRRSQ